MHAADVVGINEIFRRKTEGEYPQWSLGVFVSQKFPEVLSERRREAFIEEWDNKSIINALNTEKFKIEENKVPHGFDKANDYFYITNLVRMKSEEETLGGVHYTGGAGGLQVKVNDLGGQTVEEASMVFMKILQGNGSWAQNAVVLANAAMALFNTREYNTYEDAFQEAVNSLESKKALDSFKTLISLQ